MKNLIIALFLIPIFAYDTDSHAVEKNNSTQSAKKSKNVINYATSPFDVNVESLPANYNGHNILDIYQKINLPRVKGEFEKSEEYEARVDRWKQTPILGKITIGDTLAFQISQFMAPDTLSVKFDADNEEIAATISFKNHYLDSGEVHWLQEFHNSKNLGTYVGVTRMGVKFRVTSYAWSEIGLGFKDLIENVRFSKSYPRDEALRNKPFISAFAIVSLEYPYKIDETTSTTASLDSPEEWQNRYIGLRVKLKAIWLVNTATGEVLAKAEAPFEKCKYDICLPN